MCGSHRKKENTFKILKEVLEVLQADTEIVQISEVNIEPCRACYNVCSKEPYTCVINDDLHTVLQKMREADGIILASPLYSPVLVPSRLAVFMERLSCVCFFESMRRGTPNPLSGTPCGLIAVSGGSEPIHLLKLLANFALMLHLDVVTMKHYPYFGAWVQSPVEKDEEGMKRAHELGRLLVHKVDQCL